MEQEKIALEHLALMHHVEKLVDSRINSAIEKHEMENAHTLTDIHVRLNSIGDQLKAITDLIRSGFPDGDPATHRRVHEGYIKQAQERNQVWVNVKTKLIEASLWGVLIFVAAAIWDSFRAHVK